MIMMSISAMGVVTVLWVLYGYSMAFGNDKASIFGDPMEYFGLKGLIGGNSAAAAAGKAATDIPLAGTLPMNVFVAFQLMFAIITVALISGAVSDRLKFSSWLVFAGVWATRRLLPGRALGLRVRRRDGRARRLDRQQAEGDRLRRRNRGPHQLRYGRLGAGTGSGQAQGLADDADSVRTTFRS